jgi:SIR2-like protein
MFASVPIFDLDKNTLETWSRTGIVFLVGSYVSIFPPTNLPTGGDTTQALWQRILYKPDLDFLGKDLSDIPFEAIMQCYPNRGAIRSIIRRLFLITEPNPIHQCLASSLQRGKSTGLITTNYDLALDSALAGDPRVTTVFDKSGFERYRSLYCRLTSPPTVYFKIHGTAAIGAEDTIVCDLEAEGWLNPWKRQLLCEMVSNRTLVVIGYSGRDFDLCPELAKSTNQTHTVWLQRDRRDLQPNAERVLNERCGTLVEGDLIDFLKLLLNESLTVSSPSPQRINLDDFDCALSKLWRLQVLNWIACPKLLYESLDDFKDNHALQQALHAHSGRYRESIRELECSLRSSPATGNERLRQRIDLICSRFIYGQHVRAWLMLNQVDRELLTETSPSADLRTLAIEARMIMYMRGAQIARAFRFMPLLRFIQTRADPRYRHARKTLQDLGAWGRLEALQQNAERIGVATPDGLPLPTRRGYRSLGLVSMYMITRRDWLRTGRWRLSAEKEQEALKCIAKAEQYGWNHEAWKLSWMLLFRGNGTKRRYLRDWWEHFRVTQYPMFTRVFQLFINLIPTGDEREFEDDHYWH